jgi:hypothetical protein
MAEESASEVVKRRPSPASLPPADNEKLDLLIA